MACQARQTLTAALRQEVNFGFPPFNTQTFHILKLCFTKGFFTWLSALALNIGRQWKLQILQYEGHTGDVGLTTVDGLGETAHYWYTVMAFGFDFALG